MIEQDYPDWLAHSLLNAELRWDKAQHFALPEFFEKYNLHDSLWFGLSTKPNWATMAVIKWDTVHCVSLYPELFPRSVWSDWAFLLIDFSSPPYQIFLESNPWDAYYRPIIGAAWSKHLSVDERELLLNASFMQTTLSDTVREAYLDTDLDHTVFEQIGGGTIHLLHHSTVRLLCMDWDGNILKIPWSE